MLRVAGESNERAKMVVKSYKAIGMIGWLTFALTLGHAADVTFVEALPLRTDTRFLASHVADINNDGHLDVVGAGTFGGPTSRTFLYLNDGSSKPQFMEVEVGFGGGASSGSLNSGDVNQDGRIDLVLARSTGEVLLFLNGGQAEPVFSSFRIGDSGPYPGRAYRAASVVDIDNDGDPDIAAISSGRQDFPSAVWLFERDDPTTLTFDERIVYEPGGSDVAAVDMNGDGPIDLVRIGGGPVTDIQWLQNNGDRPSSFTVKNLPIDSGDEFRIRNVADMDGDDDIDLLALYNDDGTGLEEYWFESDGNDPPSFTRHFIGVETGEKMMVADLDLDGDMDLVDWVSEPFTRTIFWYENIDGQGTQFGYHLLTLASSITGVVQDVSLGDLDADGDIDIVFARAEIQASDLPRGALGWLENMTIDNAAVPGDGWLMFE